MKRSLLLALALLALANPSRAASLSFDCRLVDGSRANLQDLRLLVDYDAHTVTWQDAEQHPVIPATVTAEAVTFANPYSAAPAALDRKTGALKTVNDPARGKSNYLCQLRRQSTPQQ